MCLSLDQFVDSNLRDMHGTNNTVKLKGLGCEDLACFMRLKVGIFGGLLYTRWWAFCFCIFIPVAYRLNSVSCPSLMGFRDHTQTHHTRLDSSGRVISTTQIPLPNKHKRESCLQRVRYHNRRKRGTAAHTFDRTVTFSPHSGENLVTCRGPARFPYRLCSMLLDNNGQRPEFP